MDNSTNASDPQDPYAQDLAKGVSLTILWIMAVVGNVLTLAVVLRYKLKIIPHILVFGQASTDLVAAIFPIPVTNVYYYVDFGLDEGSPLCLAYSVAAEFTRYSAALVVTCMLLDRCFWVLRPIQYAQGVYHKYFLFFLPALWLFALVLAVLPFLPDVEILAGQGLCLFAFDTWYGVAIVIFGGVQSAIVLVCFCILMNQLRGLFQRRRKVVIRRQTTSLSRLSNEYSRKGSVGTLTDLGQIENIGENGNGNGAHVNGNGTLNSIRLDSTSTVDSDTFKVKLKTFWERIKPSVEQQYAIMFTCIMILFYISWFPILVCHIYVLMYMCIYASLHGIYI